MSDFTNARAARHEGAAAHDEGTHLTMSPNAPLRPETGSPLDMLLRRQSLGAFAGGLLGYVPAQVR